ncbi:MAG: hypothetical protein ACOZIN_11735 [Myxococcota bacterium]
MGFIKSVRNVVGKAAKVGAFGPAGMVAANKTVQKLGKKAAKSGVLGPIPAAVAHGADALKQKKAKKTPAQKPPQVAQYHQDAFVPHDAGARRAIRDLNAKQPRGPISGEMLANAIFNGTVDRDNQAAGAEFFEFMRWAKKNEFRLTPEAKQVLQVYEKYARQAQAEGETGIPVPQLRQMWHEMRHVCADPIRSNA